jgi:hypothetical protein
MSIYPSPDISSTGYPPDTPSEHVVNMDMGAWRSTAPKLTLRETGELVRSLIRAQAAKRPNREQRILLAIFTRHQPMEEAS